MKAWNVHQKYGDATAIVFAETAGKAKTTALATENFWGSDFLDVEVHRQPGADQFYTPGKTEMDWCDPQDRINMVKYFGFSHKRANHKRTTMESRHRTATAQQACRGVL